MNQASGELQVAGFCLASSYCGNIICKVLLCRKLLREYKFEAPVLCQAIAEFQFAGLALHQALEELQFARPRSAPNYWRITAIPVRHIS